MARPTKQLSGTKTVTVRKKQEESIDAFDLGRIIVNVKEQRVFAQIPGLGRVTVYDSDTWDADVKPFVDAVESKVAADLEAEIVKIEGT